MKRPVAIWLGLTILAVGSLGAGALGSGRVRSIVADETRGGFYASTRDTLREQSLRARGVSLAAISNSAGPGDLDAITRAYEQTFSGLGPGELATELIAELWARHDPARALARALAWKPYRRQQFVPPLMNAWARLQGPPARDRLDAIEADTLRAEAEKAVALGLLERRGDEGFEQYWAEWPFGQAALAEVLSRIALRDGFEALIERVEGLPTEAPQEFRGRVLRGVAALGGRVDPTRTAPLVEAYADVSLEGLRNPMAPFASAWAQSEPRAALDWLMSQAPGPHRNAALRLAYRPWALDPQTSSEAVEWIEAQPAETRSTMPDFYALALASVDPDRAIAVAKSIQAPNRVMILERVNRRVRAGARSAASAAAEGGPRVDSSATAEGGP